MGVDCQEPPSGCGIDDKCPQDTICSKGGDKHECSGKGLYEISE